MFVSWRGEWANFTENPEFLFFENSKVGDLKRRFCGCNPLAVMLENIVVKMEVLNLGLRLWQIKAQVKPPPSVTTRRSYLDGNDAL